MKTLSLNISRTDIFLSILLDAIALSLVYLIPTLSHLSGLPLYFAEPMRFMIILSVAHSRKINSIFLALSLPLFSFIISSHPVLPKMLLISFELMLNLFLIGFLQKRIRNLFSVMFLSIIFSKVAYYFIKYFMIEQAVLDMNFFSTPIEMQFITTLIFSLYVYFVIGIKSKFKRNF